MVLSALDFVFLAIIAILTIRAIVRGFVREFMSVAGLVLGIVVAILFSSVVARKLVPYLGASGWTQIAAFLGLFIVVYLIVKLFESGLNRLVEAINLDSLDRALGFFLGIVEGLIVVFVVLLLMRIQPFFDVTTAVGKSVFAQVLLPLMPYATKLLNIG